MIVKKLEPGRESQHSVKNPLKQNILGISIICSRFSNNDASDSIPIVVFKTIIETLAKKTFILQFFIHTISSNLIKVLSYNTTGWRSLIIHYIYFNSLFFSILIGRIKVYWDVFELSAG